MALLRLAELGSLYLQVLLLMCEGRIVIRPFRRMFASEWVGCEYYSHHMLCVIVYLYVDWR